MNIRQIRNATLFLEIGEHKLLVDPVLGEVGSFSSFKMFGGGGRRNPIVPLPAETQESLDQVTAVLITHAHHVDHLDPAGLDWIRERKLPVWCSRLDAATLREKGLDVHEVHDGFLGMRAEVVPAKHGPGPMGWFMGTVTGFFLACPGEPSLYLTSDAVLSRKLLAAVDRLQPDVVVAPAGAANFGIGPDILFSVDELVALARRAPGELVFNHLEAVDHCPTTRGGLRKRMEAEGLGSRTHVPEDGEALTFVGSALDRAVKLRPGPGPQPGLQKWVVNQIAKVM